MSEQANSTLPKAAAILPPTYVSRITILVGNDGIARLVFGNDMPGGDIEWLESIAMTNANLESLYTSLGNLMQQAAAMPPGTKPS